MRTIIATLIVLLAGCGGGQEEAPRKQPTPTPAPPPPAEQAPAEQAPADAAPAEEAAAEPDFASMSEEDQHAFLLKLGEEVYKSGAGGIACMTCHMENGQGTPGAFPPLVGQKEHMGDCVKHAGIVIHGMTGELVVDGVTYNGVMTPQGDLLDDLKIAAVISYERNSWGNDYGFCKPEDVAKARAQ